MKQLVLLGDSIFDNKSYVQPTEPDVQAQVRQVLGQAWAVTLLAADGSRIEEVLSQQLAAISPEVDAIVVSAGGNNVLDYARLLGLPATSVAEVLDMLAEVAANFEQLYSEMAQRLQAINKPLILCTIYNPCYPEPPLQRRASTALKIFNDCILRQALTAGAQILDLRAVCTESSDYANPIEPSAKGGAKIAAAIARIIK